MRAPAFIAALCLSAAGCTFLFPLDDVGGSSATDAGASPPTPAPDAARDAASDAPLLAYPAAVLADAPVLYLRFGEKSGSDARDETGNRPSLYGPKATLGAKGALLNDADTAATFTGADSSTVHIPAGLDFPGRAPFTLEVWAMQTATTDFGWAVDHQVYGAGRNSWGLRFSPGGIGLDRYADNMLSNVSGPLPLTLNTYQHVVTAYDGTMVTIYVDGKAVQTGTSTNMMHPMSGGWAAGSQNCGCSSSNFIGSLDELAVYDKALPAARVLAHYHASGR